MILATRCWSVRRERLQCDGLRHEESHTQRVYFIARIRIYRESVTWLIALYELVG